MTAVHIQQREDAALGAAWRRCEAALPQPGWECYVWRQTDLVIEEFFYYASANNGERTEEIIKGAFHTPTEALEALAAALEDRKAAE